MSRGCFAHLADLRPGMIGFEGGESLFSHLKNNKTIARKFLIRHFPAIQQSLAMEESDDAFWLPGVGNAADGLPAENRAPVCRRSFDL